jgi:hypothetical protein
LSLDDLADRLVYKPEKHRNVKKPKAETADQKIDRILKDIRLAKILRQEGKSNKQIADRIGYSYGTLRKYLNLYNDGGREAIANKIYLAYEFHSKNGENGAAAREGRGSISSVSHQWIADFKYSELWNRALGVNHGAVL